MPSHGSTPVSSSRPDPACKEDNMTDTTPHIYRVDKFTVPAASRDEFLARAREAKDFLQRQEGFVRSTYLEQLSGSGVYNLVTIVEWESQAHVEKVVSAVASRERMANTEGMETRERFYRRLGITAELGFFREVQVPG